MGEIAIETLAEEMYQMVAECAGKKNLKATDLTKEMIAKHGEGACDKEDCKKAIRLLIAAGRLLNAARRFASQKKGVRSQESE